MRRRRGDRRRGGCPPPTLIKRDTVRVQDKEKCIVEVEEENI